MPPVTVFTTTSDIEASVVTALLDSHGIASFRISGNPQAIWPMTVNSMGRIRIAVPESAADEARRIIDSHREDVGTKVVRLRDEFEGLQRRINYRFKDRGLLEHALTHTSRAAEDASGGVADNESLEFLGDAVLGLVVADVLFRRFPEYDEGQKSKVKASVVSTASLARHAEQMGLGDHLLLGRGEEKTGGRFKQALLADAYEALIAAVYLDGGFDAATAFLQRELMEAIDLGASQTIVGQDFSGRATIPCIGTDRADLILPGCAILGAIMDNWPCATLRVADRGLREGMLIALLRESESSNFPHPSAYAHNAAAGDLPTRGR